MIDKDTMEKAKASVAEKLPTLKSAKVTAAVSVVLMALPTIAVFVPQISPFIGAINAIARLFGYGV